MPNLSSKEYTALGEQLGLEKMLVSKYRAMASQESCPELSQKLESIACKHQRHYDELKSFIG